MNLLGLWLVIATAVLGFTTPSLARALPVTPIAAMSEKGGMKGEMKGQMKEDMKDGMKQSDGMMEKKPDAMMEKQSDGMMEKKPDAMMEKKR